MLKFCSSESNLVYTVQNIYEEDESLESDIGISGKNTAKAKAEASDDSSDVNLDDLMDEMKEPINLAEKDNLKLNSMHHFKLKPRDVV